MIPIAKPVIGEEEIEAVNQVLRSGMLVQGIEVKQFEEDFSEYIGVRNSIACCNGTTALDMVIKALKLQWCDEVIVPAFTFIATANCVINNGVYPVFADINPHTFNIDPIDVQRKITKDTKAIIGVHLYGHPFAREIREICYDTGITLIEDCAQACGAEYNGKKVGSMATGCFSFYPTKNMTTGEGGMITTDDDTLTKKLRLMRNHGDTGKYDHALLGHNYRMNEIQAAIGQVQLRRLDEFNKTRIRNAEFLNENISIEGITTPYKEEGVKHVYSQYTIKIEDFLVSTRKRLMEYLFDAGIGTAVHYPMPIYGQTAYNNLKKTKYPVSEKIAWQVLSLPVHPSVTQDELEYIAQTINAFEG